MTGTTKTTKRTAKQAYNEHRAAILKMLAEILDATTTQHPANKQDCDWGDVGDLHHLREQLKDPRDMLMGEGEYGEKG